MPITSTLNQENNLIRTICTDVIYMDDFYAWFEYLAGNDLVGCHEIFDTRAADWSKISYLELMTISEKASKVETIDVSTKFAWVICKAEVETLTKFYTSIKILHPGKSRTLRSFYDYDEALQWFKE